MKHFALLLLFIPSFAWAQPVADAKVVTDAAISAGQTTLTSASANFSASDVGKPINVLAAGGSNHPLVTTIDSVTSSTKAELADSAVVGISGTKAWFGTDNTAYFQNALDADLEAIVPPGSYVVTDTLRMPSNSVLHGSGRIVWIDATLDDVRLVGVRESAAGNSNMRVESLTIDFEPIRGMGGGAQPIRFSRTKHTYVIGTKIITRGQGILHVGASDYVVAHNLLQWVCADVNSAGDGGIDQWDGSHGGVIEGNIIEGNNCIQYAILLSGINNSSASSPVFNIVVANNAIRDARIVGIQLQGEYANTDVRDVIVQGNIIDGVSGDANGGIGIKLRNCNSVVVSGNKVKNTGEQGISTSGIHGCDNAIIDGNIIEGANQKHTTNNVAGAGIALVSGTANCIVTNNRIHGTTHYRGIRLAIGSVNNIVAGNLIDPSVASPTILNDGTNNHIVDNW